MLIIGRRSEGRWLRAVLVFATGIYGGAFATYAFCSDPEIFYLSVDFFYGVISLGLGAMVLLLPIERSHAELVLDECSGIGVLIPAGKRYEDGIPIHGGTSVVVELRLYRGNSRYSGVVLVVDSTRYSLGLMRGNDSRIGRLKAAVTRRSPSEDVQE